MKLFIAADHGGFTQKEQIEYHYDVENKDVDSELIEVIDLGAEMFDPQDDYPPFAFKLCEAILTARASLPEHRRDEVLGVLICKSGIGMSIAANKVKGCYAALCTSAEQARRAREHNHANILVLDAEFIDINQNFIVLLAFIHAKPQTGRHERRINQIKDYEYTK